MRLNRHQTGDGEKNEVNESNEWCQNQLSEWISYLCSEKALEGTPVDYNVINACD